MRLVPDSSIVFARTLSVDLGHSSRARCPPFGSRNPTRGPTPKRGSALTEGAVVAWTEGWGMRLPNADWVHGDRWPDDRLCAPVSSKGWWRSITDTETCQCDDAESWQARGASQHRADCAAGCFGLCDGAGRGLSAGGRTACSWPGPRCCHARPRASCHGFTRHRRVHYIVRARCTHGMMHSIKQWYGNQKHTAKGQRHLLSKCCFHVRTHIEGRTTCLVRSAHIGHYWAPLPNDAVPSAIVQCHQISQNHLQAWNLLGGLTCWGTRTPEACAARATPTPSGRSPPSAGGREVDEVARVHEADLLLGDDLSGPRSPRAGWAEDRQDSRPAQAVRLRRHRDSNRPQPFLGVAVVLAV